MRKRRVILMIALGLAGITLFAQQPSATLYHMAALPDRAFLNPAFQPQAKLYIGSPGFTQLHFEIGNTGFSFNDIFRKTDTGFVIDPGKTIESMPPLGRIGADFLYKPIAFGFRVFKQGYFTFDAGPRFSLQYYYPKDLFGFVWKGNAHEDYLGKRVSFDNMGIEMSLINEISAGYSHQVFKGVTIGVRAKMINGIANIHTERSILGLTTDADDFGLTVDLDYRIRANAPLIDFDSLITGTPPEDFDPAVLQKEGLDYLKKNRGFAWDIGATWLLYDRIFLSAAVNDLGYIDWRGNPFTVESKGTFTFTGFDLNEFINNGVEFDTLIKELTDSIINIFEVKTGNKGYRQHLTPHIQIGAGLYISRDDMVGFHLRNKFYKGMWFPKLTLSYNHRFGRLLSVSGSYGMERGNFTNLGIGVAVKIGFLQYYLITDNALAFFYPLSAKGVNILTGFQYVFGTKQQKKEGKASI